MSTTTKTEICSDRTLTVATGSRIFGAFDINSGCPRYRYETHVWQPPATQAVCRMIVHLVLSEDISSSERMINCFFPNLSSPFKHNYQYNYSFC
jgi:hypothetical protein